MGIKLYKSQLTPTAESSNVIDRRKISLAEAASVGKAWKGMVQAGEKLYYKHLDNKTDNEILEKSKEVMNGTEAYDGLSKTKVEVSQMNDPDQALKTYNDNWQNIFDTVNGSLSGKMAQRKFKSWMTMQNIKDANSIKSHTTSNFIQHTRTLNLDKIEVWKKQIIYGGELESTTATNELKFFLENSKAKEIFGEKLDAVIKQTHRDIAFYGYKNVASGDQDAALTAAKKDKRLDIDDVQKLITYFDTAKSKNNHLNKDKVKKMETSLEHGIPINAEEFAAATKIATENEDATTLVKLKNMQIDSGIYNRLSLMSVGDIENKVNILRDYVTKKRLEGKGIESEYANELVISEKYLAALTSDLDKDQLITARDRNLITLNEIGFEKLLSPDSNVDEFLVGINDRIAKAKTVAAIYKRDVKFLTVNETKAIKTAFDSATTEGQIIGLATALVKGFGVDSDTLFKQISKDDTFLAHVGGLVMMSNGEPGMNTKLAVQGYLLSKNKDLAAVYKMKKTDTKLLAIIADKDYQQAFGNNRNTFNNVIETANYIYAAQLMHAGDSTNEFKAQDWEKAFIMAAGGWTNTKGWNKDYGGFDQTSRGTTVHIPPWVERGTFEDIIETIKDYPILLKKASSNGEFAVTDKGEEFVNIFKNEDPYFVSIGNGKYKLANGDNPFEPGGEPEFLLNSDGGFFIIDINQIKTEIITRLY